MTLLATVSRVRIETKRFGELEVDEARVLRFDDGLPGFPDDRRFALVDARDGDDVFYWLQSLDDPAVAFLAAVPWLFFPDYEPELPEADQALLGLERAADALVLCLLTVHRDQQTITANLLGPVIVNQQTRHGRQVVLAESRWPVQAPLAAAA